MIFMAWFTKALRRLALGLLSVVCVFSMLTTNASAAEEVVHTDGTYIGHSGTYNNEFYIEDNGVYRIAYCFNYRFHFTAGSQYYMKIENASAASMNKYSDLENTPSLWNGKPEGEYDPLDQTMRNAVLNAVYHGYPNNGGYERSDNRGIWASSKLADWDDPWGYYAFRLATQCAIWHYTDGATLENMESNLVNVRRMSYNLKKAFETAYYALIDEDLQHPDDYSLDLFIHKNTDRSVQNLLATTQSHPMEETTTLSVEFKKYWVDGNNANNNRPSPDDFLNNYIKLMAQRFSYGAEGTMVPVDPEPVEFTIADPVTATCAVSTEGNNIYMVTFANLPKYDADHNVYEYTVKETAIPGYTASDATGNMIDGFQLTNTEENYTYLEISKFWVDNFNADAKRPDEATFTSWLHLYAQPEGGAKEEITGRYPITVTKDRDNPNEYLIKIPNLPKIQNGRTVTYTVEEVVPSDSPYRLSTGANGDLSNTYYEDVTISKTWIDGGDADHIRPTVQQFAGWITLMAHSTGSTEWQPVADAVPTVSADGNVWTISYANLPKYDENGPLYYMIEEHVPDGRHYGQILADAGGPTKPYNMINVELIEFTVDKKWIGEAKDSVTVHLLANGEAVEDYTLTAEDDWTIQLEYPKYDEEGQLVEYTIKEDPVEGYETTITGSTADGFVITNSNVPNTGDSSDLVKLTALMSLCALGAWLCFDAKRKH